MPGEGRENAQQERSGQAFDAKNVRESHLEHFYGDWK
jgi:hypothetical protein